MSKALIAAAVVIVVIITECALAYMLIPSSTQLETHFQAKAEAKAAPAATEPEKEAAHGGKAQADKPEMEIELGKFNLVIHQPASNLTLRINSTLR